MRNSQKLLIILLSTAGICIIIGIIGVVFGPDKWYWVVGALFIGFLIAGGPLLRAYVKAKKQEEMNLSDELLTPAKGVTCTHCGYELHHKVSYCDNCGQKVRK
ncbi:MAG: zinc ribbon domain-containing protein [Candidatus Heimdallarchaeota archaeon]|nr:zinc ribbon domain-containing protein [Candidatus Heimdallarchaeota archaeon]